MRVWRVCRKPFVKLDGSGAGLIGGRWNTPGGPMVYASSHLSLALLEVLVHLELEFDELPDDYVSVEIDIPKQLSIKTISSTLDLFDLEETRRLGDLWLSSAESAVLSVPSCVIPQELNYCINPAHADFSLIRTMDVQPFQFDTRLF
ncbi:MAG: RES family NAD+ phosphorylase [Candidatus Thiodiazotropha sp. (ex Lucinoma borealis)]|nr:RES family NAD+ phosphorylase [Candidatus Thiodiazotropha sp. (ex Lucinoma borealis)]MCU7865401.1 RES family NAD+ phosphorylase [Candidatus Thiodiazotropha sp. (ex Lucinoma borealis)]